VASEQGRQIDVEEVTLDDVDRRGHPAGQSRDQVAIDLHRDQPSGARRERRCQRTPAGTNLEERLVRVRVHGGHQFRDPRRFQEVLAEALARSHSSSSSSGPRVSPRQ
jgi:hypothetical protein